MDIKYQFKKILPAEFLFKYLSFKIYYRNSSYIKKRYYSKWIESGKPLPPPHVVKQMVIEQYKNSHDIGTLIETGTYLGDMVFSQKDNFNKIISIELQPFFYEEAKRRFSKYNNIELLQGDSSKILRFLAEDNIFNKPCLFWLDGHYSAGDTAKGEKETPILEELQIILNTGQNHVLLIDDARCFIGENDYPTIEQVKSLILQKYPDSKFSVSDDIIRIELK